MTWSEIYWKLIRFFGLISKKLKDFNWIKRTYCVENSNSKASITSKGVKEKQINAWNNYWIVVLDSLEKWS